MAICSVCEKINLPDFFADKYTFRHKTHAELVVSAVDCLLCALILELMASMTRTVDYNSIRIGAMGRPDNTRPILLVGQNLKQDPLDKHLGDEDQVFLGLKVAFPREEYQDIDRYASNGQYLEGTLRVFIDNECEESFKRKIPGRLPTSTIENLERAKEWYNWCELDHTACTFPNDMPLTIPARLVDVGSPDGVIGPSLVETTKDQKHDYLALSYCWGNAEITKTTINNLNSHKNAIMFGSLSRVFQDAIKTTRALGYRYIWIDALCIIQDSTEDWDREAACMAEIYANASITLSAAVSKSADDGLFLPRQSSKAVRLTDQRYSVTATSFSNFEEDVLSGALSRRGWTLQERLLSRRIIHFGQDQLHWECQTALRSEDFDGSTGEYFGNKIFWVLDKLLHEKNPHSGGLTPYFYWYHIIVMEYSKRYLSYQSDKLVAIMGIAELFRKKLKDRYIWGLWEKDLARGILWNATSEWCSRTSDTGAPSWSWLSINGPVGYGLPCKIKKIIVKDLSVSMDANNIDAFGVAKPGVLSLTGPIRLLHELKCTPKRRTIFGDVKDWTCLIDSRDLDCADKQVFFAWLRYKQKATKSIFSWFRPNNGWQELPPEGNIHCLMVAHMECEREGICCHLSCHERAGMALLLQLVEGDNTYKRIGSLCVAKADFCFTRKKTIHII